MAHVLAGDYTPLSAVDIFVKDLGIVLDTARATQVPAAAGVAPRTRCSCRPPPPASAARTTRAVIKIFPGIELPREGRRDACALLGCIADDFTGATDLANNLVRAGMRTVQTIGVPERRAAGEPRSMRWWSR